uniref:Solute-binding protein family 5 domain-containing protein n=1 Tax=candidate division WOR-3 bacterium TaxID=2052148 RepID=A0A7V0Z4B1_UNCW3
MRGSILLLVIFTYLSCCTEKIKPTPRGELKVAWLSGLVGIDPTKDWGCAGAMKFIRLIYSPLYNEENQELGIAKGFKHSSDYTEWEFILKRDCYFHPDPCFKEGIRVANAYDVKYTFEKIKNSWPYLEPVITSRKSQSLIRSGCDFC